jgi:iron complex transport system substrate-binding protein
MIHQDELIIERNPDIIIGSWCGKKFRPNQLIQRAGWENISAVKNQQIFEIKSPFILQPGPAALTEGVEQIHQIILNWQNNQLMQ